MAGTSPAYCADCGTSRVAHRAAWLERAFDSLLPTATPRFLPHSVVRFFGRLLEYALRGLRLVRLEHDFPLHTLPRRTALFIEAARKRGMVFAVLHGPWGYTNNLHMHLNGKAFPIEGLPNAGWLNGRLADYADDKWAAKQILARAGFPVAEGRAFWQWNIKGAVQYGRDTLGFPLVVKPRSGSVARHVTINITSEVDLRAALRHAFSYSPAIIVERYIPGYVYRFTVVDGSRVFCVRQVPAHVTGDGKQTVRSLMAQKNAQPERHIHPGETTFYHPIRETADAEVLAHIPADGEQVWLAEDPFMRNGGDLEEVSESVHADNRILAQNVAKRFGMKLVAFDFICEDITQSWKEQSCAILELNSLPSIEMHHLPSRGEPQDVAGAIADMAVRYYR